MLTLWNRPLNPEPGWWFQIYFIFHPDLGEDSHFDEHIFKGVGFNHQLVFIVKTIDVLWIPSGVEYEQKTHHFFSLTRNSIFLKLNASPRNQNLPPTTIYLLEMEFISQFKASMNLGWIFWTRFLRQVSWWQPTWDWREWKQWTMSKSISMTRLSPVCTVFIYYDTMLYMMIWCIQMKGIIQ